MRYFLLSNKTCDVILNGKFLGSANGNLALLPFYENEFLLQLIPSFPLKSTVAKIKNGVSNHPNVKIIDLYGDFLIIPHFDFQTFNKFEICFDKTFENPFLRTSILFDGYLKVIIENTFGVFCEPLRFTNGKVTASAELIENTLIFTLSQNFLNYFFCFSVEKKPTLIFKSRYNQISKSNNGFLLTETPPLINLNSIQKFITLNPFNVSTTATKKREPSNIPCALLPYAFLQELQYGCDFTNYLTAELKESSRFVKEFLCDFFAFAPAFNYFEKQTSQNENFNSEHQESIILVSDTARILTVTINNNLISDLTLN